ncbi:hypothetical protein HOLleu_20788 [Holothuria leucospilota]|uniref:Transmembrane protein n=1 Tax=Holothuria leucospilota TaxID=206669 RepID=A0A9Q1C221_HOLLE|nr:hypothetical protein HOLleu_20788 [Holothuria leucospilota]
MNTTLFSATSDAFQAKCAPLVSLKDVLLYFCVPLTLASLALFIIPAVFYLIRTPKRKIGRFKIELQGRQDCNLWRNQERMRVKLVGIRRGDTDECSECQWKEFDYFSSGKMSALFQDGNGRFKELTAACFVLPREESDVLEQCEKCIETCVVKDLHTGVWYKYNTSSRLSSFSPSTANSVGPEHRIVFVRLHKIGSNVEETIRGMSSRCRKLFTLLFKCYCSLTSPFLCTHHTKLTHLDQSMILVSKVLFSVVTVSILQVFVPTNRMPFRHYFKNFEYSMRDFTLDGDDLYISTAAALLSFVGSMPFEIFLRLIRFILTAKYSTTESIIKEPSTLTCSKKERLGEQKHFEEMPNSSFQLEATFKNVIEELKVRLASIGLRRSYSNNSRGTSVSSQKAQRSVLKHYRTLPENDTTSLGKETIPLESVPNFQKAPPEGSSPGTCQPMSWKASRTTATIPYQRNNHIYAEISDDFIAVKDEEGSSSTSEGQELGTRPSQSSCPSVVLLALEDQQDRRQNWPGDSYHLLKEFHDPAVLMDIDATRIKFKKDCRHSRYKGANQNSSCAADPLPTSGSLESTNNDIVANDNLVIQSKDDTKQATYTKATVAASSTTQRQHDINTENLTWHKTDSEATVNDSTCHQKEDQIYLNNSSSNSPSQAPIALVVEGEYRQFARGDCNTTNLGEDTVSTVSNSKMVKYRDVLSRGMKVKKALVVRGKNYIDNFRDMSKAIIRSLSLSSVGDESVTTFSEQSESSGVTKLPGKVPEKKSSSSVPHLMVRDGHTQSEPLQNNTSKRSNKMTKTIYHGVTIAQPEEDNPSILHRLKLWLSNIFVNTKTQSDQSDDTDTDVGCMANMTSKDVTKRQNHISQNRKQIVSETFTSVTMDSTLLHEPPIQSVSGTSEREVMPDVLQSSIFKGVAGNIPFRKPSFQSASHEEVWKTSSETQGKRKLSQNRNNNMNKMAMSLGESSSSSSFQDGKKLKTELIHLLANPFPEIGDDTSSVAPNSSSSRTILEQLDKVAPWQSSSATSRSPSPEPKPLDQIFLPGEKVEYKRVQLQKDSCLDRAVFLFSLIFFISAIVCSTYSVSYLCRQQLQHLWILIVLSTVTLLVGFDLLKAFIISATHLVWFPHTW